MYTHIEAENSVVRMPVHIRSYPYIVEVSAKGDNGFVIV